MTVSPPLIAAVSAATALLFLLAVTVFLQRRRLRQMQERLTAMQQLLEARAKQLERATKSIRDEGTGDELTGVTNHRSFQEILRHQWRRTARSRLPLTVLMIDVDGLKQFNEARGQQAGDESLRQIAVTLVQEIQRPGDVVARFGGDEFAVLLAETDAAGGLSVAERMRHAVENLAMSWGPKVEGQMLTISVGVATTVPSPQEQPGSLLATADRALSSAKRNGRNRVES